MGEEVTTVVEIITPTDTIAFHPTPDITGFVYDNETLDAWYEQAEADADENDRPNAHGAFALGEIFLKAHKPILVGQFYGETREGALAARGRLSLIFNDGNPVVMRVTDELGVTSRQVWLLSRRAPFRNDFTHFPFDLAFTAPDPRRYGIAVPVAIRMPSAGSGLVWNLGTAPSGLYFDWGTEGVSGLVSYTNTGEATTFPRIEVGGAGAFASGFRVTEVETGRELTVTRATNTGDVVVLDSRTQRATIANGGGDITGSMTSRDWFEIPSGATRRYQITPLGAVSGAPMMTLYAAPAYL